MNFPLPRLTSIAILATVCRVSDTRVQTTTSGGWTRVVTDQSGAVMPNTHIETKDNRKANTQPAKTDKARTL